jgi:Ca2+-binding RTX toxin-like protein
MAATIDYDLVTLRSQFQANTFVTWNQWTPDVLGLSNGGHVVAYNNGPDFGWAMKVDFYGADGHLLAGAVTPNMGSTSAGGEPSLTELDNGNVLIIWDDNSVGNLGQQATIFSSTGQVVVSQFDITTSVNDFRPQVTTLAGGFVVSYMDTAGNLNFKVFDNDGAYQSGLTDISGSLSVANPVITALEDGGFVVAWTAANNIVARIFEADGSPRPVNGSTDPFTVGAGGNNLQPAVAALPNGNFAVAYSDTGWGGPEAGSAGITLTVVGPGGNIVKPFVHVNTAGASNESDPDITVLENGFIVVTWTDPAGNNEIMGRIFDQDGNPIGSPLPLSDSAGSDDIKSAVSAILAGQFITAWQDSESDGDGGRITALVSEIVRTTTGDGANETLNGDALRDIIHGNGGNDTINGFGGNDTLDGGAGADTMFGGAGDDIYIVAAAGDVTTENAGEGTDTVRSYIDWVLANHVERLELQGSGNLNGTGNALANTLVGNAGNNLLNGGAGNDYMVGGSGNDTFIVAAAGDSTIEAAAGGTDTVRSYINWTLGANVERLELQGSGNLNGTGNTLNNTLVGNSGNNSLNGGDGNDYIVGGAGNDTLTGGVGNDTLIGGAGSDILNGGTGNDRFDFDLVSDSPAGPALRDSILGGFAHGFDRIDLATIDANTLVAGNQAFSFIGSAAFSGVAGQLRYTNYSGNVIIAADVNGDSTADMQILVAGTTFMTGTDFIL